MGAMKTFLGLCLMFVAWIVVGIANVVVLQSMSSGQFWAAPIMIVWLISGPAWAVLFIRWRGKRFSKAYDQLREKFARDTHERLKGSSVRN
jgi:hypothetical protein